jgi:hydrogenase maturation protease
MRLRHRVDNEYAQNGAPGRVLIGGVGYRWQRDASFGLVASDALSRLEWPAAVEVADLGYGAIFVSQDIGDADPPYERLILLAAAVRDREPGKLYPYEWTPTAVSNEEIQARIYEAGAGVIDLDHLLIIARHFNALPNDVQIIELEPLDSEGGEGLSPQVSALLPTAVAMAREWALGEEWGSGGAGEQRGRGEGVR